MGYLVYDVGGRTFVISIIYPDYFAAMVRSTRAERSAVFGPVRAQGGSVPSCAEGRSTLGDFVHKMGSELVATAARASRTDATAGPV